MKKKVDSHYLDKTLVYGVVLLVGTAIYSLTGPLNVGRFFAVIFGPPIAIGLSISVWDKYHDWFMAYGRWVGGVIFLLGAILAIVFLPQEASLLGAWGVWIAAIGIIMISSTLKIFLKKANNHGTTN